MSRFVDRYPKTPSQDPKCATSNFYYANFYIHNWLPKNMIIQNFNLNTFFSGERPDPCLLQRSPGDGPVPSGGRSGPGT